MFKTVRTESVSHSTPAGDSGSMQLVNEPAQRHMGARAVRRCATAPCQW